MATQPGQRWELSCARSRADAQVLMSAGTLHGWTCTPWWPPMICIPPCARPLEGAGCVSCPSQLGSPLFCPLALEEGETLASQSMTTRMTACPTVSPLPSGLSGSPKSAPPISSATRKPCPEHLHRRSAAEGVWRSAVSPAGASPASPGPVVRTGPCGQTEGREGSSAKGPSTWAGCWGSALTLAGLPLSQVLPHTGSLLMGRVGQSPSWQVIGPGVPTSVLEGKEPTALLPLPP